MSESSDQNPISILLIEDNDDHAELISYCLTTQASSEISIVRLCDGDEARAYIREQGKKSECEPSLVIADINLPKVSGLELLKEINQQTNFRRTPVIMLTTSKSDKDMAAAYSDRVNSYLVKPVDFDDLKRMVQCLCEYWLRWNITH